FHGENSMKRASSLGVVLLLAGCGLFTGPGDDLQDARDRWASAGLASYYFQYTQSCFCGGLANQNLMIQVTAGHVTDAWTLEDVVPVARELLPTLPTVPDLLEIADRAVREAYRRRLSYHEFFGYPTTMDIDWIKNAADDEVVYYSSCLRQTSPEAATSEPCRPPPP
ncbi:MAG: DUF6174 domain-containing protein, partial [Gemmatimonadota bacterium]